MVKTFKSYVTELAQGTTDTAYKGEADDAGEVVDYLPRSKGERDFAALHVVVKKDHPVAPDTQFGSPLKQEDSAGPVRNVQGGERAQVEQGTSKLGSKAGFKGVQTSARKGDNRQGDARVVLQGSSVLEQVLEQAAKNERLEAQWRQPLSIVLENDDKLIIDANDLRSLAATHSKLTGENREVFERKVQQGSESFNQVLRFSRMVK